MRVRPTGVAAILSLTACGRHSAPDSAHVVVAGPDRHALVVVLDGVRTEEITAPQPSDLTGVPGPMNAPSIWSTVAPDATIVRSILNPGLTSTAPGHASIVTGRAEGLFTLAFDHGDVGLYRPLVPTIFEMSNASGIGARSELVANSVVMPGVSESLMPGLEGLGATWYMVPDPADATSPEDDDGPVLDLLERIYGQPDPPRLVVANFHDADRTGHAAGDYPGRVAIQDQLVARLHDWLAARPDLAAGMLVIVTADHGRHRHDDDGGWHNHGDSCTGCREVPLIVWGEGVPAGAVRTDRLTLLDVAPTVAGHLGFDFPTAQGMPFPFAETAQDAPVRTGLVDLDVTGGHTAARRFRDDLDARSEVVVDDEVVSTPGVFMAEGPRLSVGADTLVCFRELDPVIGADFWPWTPRCLAKDGASWRDIGFADDIAGPFFRVSFATSGGKVWAAWLHTPLVRDVDGDVDELRVASWTAADGWSTTAEIPVEFTSLDLSLVATDQGLVAAMSTSLPDPNGPYTRRVITWTLNAQGVWTGATTIFQLEDQLTEPRRVEHPALSWDGSTVRLAMLGMDDAGIRPFVATSADRGASWTAPAALATSDTALPNLAPVWTAPSTLSWASWNGTEVTLCTSDLPDIASCAPTGQTRLDSLVWDGAEIVVSTGSDDGAWTVLKDPATPR